jgi:plasmid stability protein
MSQILIRDLDPEVVTFLKRRAEQNRRSLQAEVRLILEEASRQVDRPSVEELVRRADEIRARSGPQKTDSVDLLREDRDNR